MTQRHDIIKEILANEKRVEVTALSKRLDVSEVTIRKDLTDLELHGFLVRRYGGAILAENPQQVVEVSRKHLLAATEKQYIASCVANLIEDGENILLDAGSTTLFIAKELINRDVRIVTNSLAIANEFLSAKGDARVEMIGGSLRFSSGALVGSRAKEALESLRVDKVILGCSGFDETLGFSSENIIEAETKKAMLACGGQKIIVADNSKFTRPAFAPFALSSEIDMVVTDKKIDKEVSNILRSNDVTIKIGDSKCQQI